MQSCCTLHHAAPDGSTFCCRDKLIYDIGTIKLADFGLSKSLPINKHVAFDLDDTYTLTGETGSYRYMVCGHSNCQQAVIKAIMHSKEAS